LAAALKQEQPTITIQLVEGDRGIFEVRTGERVIFSKKTEGRFPSAADVLSRIK